MELTLKSINGLLLNDHTNFDSGFVTDGGRGAYNAPTFEVSLAELAGRPPLKTNVQIKEKYFLIEIECRGTFVDQWDTIKIAAFTGGIIPVVATDKNANDWTMDVIAVDNPLLDKSATQIGLLAPSPMWRLAQTATWSVTSTPATQTKVIHTKGNATVRPVIQFTPGQRLTSYQEREFLQLYNPTTRRFNLYAFDVTLGGWNTAALISDTAKSYQVNGAGIGAGTLTIPIDTPVGGGLAVTGGICYVPSTNEQMRYTSITGGNMIIYNSGGVTGRGWGGSTAAAIADNAVLSRSHMLKNGADIQVTVGGVKQALWFGGGGINSTTTEIVINLFLAGGVTLTLGAAMSSGATSVVFELNSDNRTKLTKLPTTGRVVIGTDIFTYTSKTITATSLKLTGKAGQYGSSPATHAVGAAVIWIPDAIFMMWGKVDEKTRVQSEARKPLQDLTTFSNTNWKWDIFADKAGLRSGRWTVKRETGKGSDTYTGSHGLDTDPATEMGLDMLIWNKNGAPQGETSRLTASINIPSGATTVSSNGDIYRYLGGWPAKAGLEKSKNGVNWAAQFTLATPSSAQSWKTWSKAAEALGASYQYLRFILDGSLLGKKGNRAALEVQSVTATLDSALIPQGTLLPIIQTHYLDVTIQNAITGEEFHVEFTMEAGETLEVDCERKTVTYLKDGLQYNSAITNPVAAEWMTFAPGVDNTLTIIEDDVVTDGVVILYDDKLM